MTRKAQKSKYLCLRTEKARLSDPKTLRALCNDDVKLVILPDMTLNVILTLIAPITLAPCTSLDPSNLRE